MMLVSESTLLRPCFVWDCEMAAASNVVWKPSAGEVGMAIRSSDRSPQDDQEMIKDQKI